MPESNGSIPFTLDGRPATASPGEVVIAAAERAGTFIPRFCYHPRMAPVGVCRMCLVEIDGPRGPTLQPACFVPVTENMQVVTDSDKVKKAQDGVLEFLLVNHPLDCPVCDKGGECPLQDQTLAHGPGDTRFLEEKRHFEKPIPLSELVLLDRERCIQCSRCTRFAAEVAGEAQIDFAGRGELVEVAAFPTEPFTSHFSGNTVQICPVGALTATPYRFTARPWDLDQVESTCTTCAVGCRVAVQSSANRVTRLLGVDSDPINHGWLCDKGRFAYEATNGPEDEERVPLTSPRRRLTAPLVRKEEGLAEVTWGEAIAAAANAIRSASARGPDAIGAIGGAACTNEAQFLWARLLKGVVGTDSVDAQLGDGLDPLLVAALPRATFDDATTAKCCLVLTGDLEHELPVLFLRLRQAALAGSTTLVELATVPSRLSEVAHVSVPVRPGDAPDTVAALLGDDAASNRLRAHPEGVAAAVNAIERAQSAIPPGGEGLVVVVGRPNVAESAAVMEAATRRIARELPSARYLVALRRGNVAGAIDLGMVPGMLPGRVPLERGRAYFTDRWGGAPERSGRDAVAQLRALEAGLQASIVLIGCDPIADGPDPELAEAALGAARDVVVVSGHGGPVLEHATVVLPTWVAHERAGTTTSCEGRVTRLGQKIVAPGHTWPDTTIAAELIDALGGGEVEADVEAVTDEIAATCATHEDVTAAAVLAADDGVVIGRGPSPVRGALDPVAFPGVHPADAEGFRMPAGAIDVPVAPPTPGGAPAPVSRDEGLAAPDAERPAHDAYALRLVAARRLYDRGAAVEASPSLLRLVEPAVARANPYDLDRIGATAGGEVRVRSRRRIMVLRCEADATVARGTLVVPLNVDAPEAGERVAVHLMEPGAVVSDVRMESL